MTSYSESENDEVMVPAATADRAADDTSLTPEQQKYVDEMLAKHKHKALGHIVLNSLTSATDTFFADFKDRYVSSHRGVVHAAVKLREMLESLHVPLEEVPTATVNALHASLLAHYYKTCNNRDDRVAGHFMDEYLETHTTKNQEPEVIAMHAAVGDDFVAVLDHDGRVHVHRGATTSHDVFAATDDRYATRIAAAGSRLAAVHNDGSVTLAKAANVADKTTHRALAGAADVADVWLTRAGTAYALTLKGCVQCVDKKNASQLLPVAVASERFQHLAVADTHALGVTTSGEVVAWGEQARAHTPTVSVRGAVRVATCAAVSAAVLKTGRVVVWGPSAPRDAERTLNDASISALELPASSVLNQHIIDVVASPVDGSLAALTAAGRVRVAPGGTMDKCDAFAKYKPAHSDGWKNYRNAIVSVAWGGKGAVVIDNSGMAYWAEK